MNENLLQWVFQNNENLRVTIKDLDDFGNSLICTSLIKTNEIILEINSTYFITCSSMENNSFIFTNFY